MCHEEAVASPHLAMRHERICAGRRRRGRRIPNVVARAEYRQTDVGDFDVNFEGNEFTADLTTNGVRFGLAWKF